MGYGNKNKVRVQGEFDDKISSPLDKLRGKFDALGKNKGANAILHGVGIGAGVSAFGLLERGISSVVDVAFDSVRAASDLNETLSKSSVIFGDNADEVAAWGKTMATAGGLSQRAALDAASGFAGLFQTVGIAVDKSADMAQSLTTMGSDLASFFNTDVDTALQALKSGLSGESEPLRKFNVFLSETAVTAKLTQMGIKKVGGAFTEAQKATARYALIMEQTGAAQGDYARTSDGLANSGRTLTAELENLQAEIGQELLPTLVELSRWAREDGVPAFKDILDLVGDVSDGLSFMVDRAQWLIDEGLTPWDNSSHQLTKSMRTLDRATFDAGRSVGDLADPLKDTEGGIDDVGDEAKESAKQLAAFTDSLKDTTESLIAASREPEQLRLELKLTKAEVTALKDELGKLTGGDGKPVKGVTWSQVNEVKLALSEAQEKADLLRFRINSLDGVSLMDSIAAVNRLGGRLDFAADKAGVLLSRLTRIGIGGTNTSGNYGARASGGPVLPGQTYTVGERGTETLVMGQRGGGFVIPHGGGGGDSGGGGGTPVVIQLNLDGRVLTQVVDRNLSYLRRTAPGVAPAAR